MNRQRIVFGAVLVLALGTFGVWCSPASAADHYGVIGLTNQTNVTLNFQYKVGDNGEWKAKSIEPGQKLWFSHRYAFANEDRSPPFYIRFDADLRGSNFQQEYRLERRQAVGQSYDQGKKYAFQYEKADRRFVDVKSLD